MFVCVLACALRPLNISQLLIGRLLCVSARVVSKQSRYDFLSGNFLSLFKCYPLKYLMFTFPCIYLTLIKRVSAFHFACSDFVPEKVKAEDALRETNLRGNRGG
jgi:hypothetical protein